MLRPHVAKKFDQADEYPHEMVEQMKELGLFGATIARGIRRAGPVGHGPTRRS